MKSEYSTCLGETGLVETYKGHGFEERGMRISHFMFHCGRKKR